MRILYLNYPKPTSAIAPLDYLERVVRRCRELDILLVYDNAYSEIAFDGYAPPSIFEIDGARDIAIEFHSEGVVVMPGSNFGAGGEGFIRVSFVTSPERIREAAIRAGRVLMRLSVGA